MMHPAATVEATPPLPSGRRRPVLDSFDIAVLVALAALSLWVVSVMVFRSGPDRIWTGTDGPFVGDQMQYLGWVEQAARHLLVANPFVVRPTRAVYLNPGLAVSGGLVRLGLSPSAAYLAWTPVAVAVLFVGARTYVRDTLAGVGRRRVALVLALFFVSPVAVLAHHFHWFGGIDMLAVEAAVTEMWPGLYLWGYPFTAIAVATLALALVAYGRDRRDARLRPWAPLLGLVCAWLQPWQGATLLGVLVLSEGVLHLRHRSGGFRLPLVTAAAVTVPLGYYTILGRVDPSWSHAGAVNHIVFPWLPVATAMLPLALAGALAYRLPAPDFRDVALRAWPIAAVGVYVAIAVGRIGTYPLHALQGLSIPLAVLAVAGVGSLHFRIRRWTPVVMVAAVLALVIPSGADQLNQARAIGSPTFGSPTPIFVTRGEQRALASLRTDRSAGAVLAPVDLGMAIPALTGRHTWVGIYSWTPDFAQRTEMVAELFAGGLAPKRAQSFVRATGARFLVSDCGSDTSLATALGSLVVSTRHFGCSTVYQVRTR